MRFFDRVIEPRFPRSVAEGVLKSLFIAGFVLPMYDINTEIPKTDNERISHSERIIKAYLLFLFIGMVCGMIGQCFFPNEREEQQNVPQR